MLFPFRSGSILQAQSRMSRVSRSSNGLDPHPPGVPSARSRSCPLHESLERALGTPSLTHELAEIDEVPRFNKATRAGQACRVGDVGEPRAHGHIDRVEELLEDRHRGCDTQELRQLQWEELQGHLRGYISWRSFSSAAKDLPKANLAKSLKS